MKRDALQMSLLLDFYGELLTEKQRYYFDLYYNQDLSLAEIAEQEGISRQGVHDVISRTEQTLLSTEKSVGFVQKSERIRKACATIETCAEALLASDDSAVVRQGQTILDAVTTLKE